MHRINYSSYVCYIAAILFSGAKCYLNHIKTKGMLYVMPCIILCAYVFYATESLFSEAKCCLNPIKT